MLGAAGTLARAAGALAGDPVGSARSVTNGGPLGAGAMNITAVSYHGRCYIGVATDPAAVPDPDVLLDCLRAGLAEVRDLALTGDLAGGLAVAGRQAPGLRPGRARPSGRRHRDLVP